MITFRTVVQILGTIPFLFTTLLAQTWSLPQDTSVKDNGPRTYRFVVDYNTANTRGEIVRRQRVMGEYTRGLPAGEVSWKNVTDVAVNSATDPFPVGNKLDFMEGFRYPNNLGDTMKPDFFKASRPPLSWNAISFGIPACSNSSVRSSSLTSS